jgi:Na+/alanine symporter
MVMCGVLCEVRTDFLNITKIRFGFKGLKKEREGKIEKAKLASFKFNITRTELYIY